MGGVIFERARLTRMGWEADLICEQVEGPLPTPSGSQVLIEVGACGVCYRDLIDRSGRFPFLQTPITPGHEAAGRVIAVGPGVSEWQVGDHVATMHRDFCGECVQCKEGQTSLCTGAAHVFGLMADGGYATHLIAPQRSLYRLPDDMPSVEGAILHCTYGTAWRGMHYYGPVGAGHKVLVTGANGGVGAAAVQIAAKLGAEVVGVVRDEARAGFVEAQGASRVLVDAEGRFHKQLGAWRADIVLDCVGQPTFNASVRSARLGGGVTVIGNVVEERATLNLGYLVVGGLHIVGSSGATRADMAAFLKLHAESPLEIAPCDKLPISKADEAQRRVKAGGLEGRLVLVPEATHEGSG